MFVNAKTGEAIVKKSLSATDQIEPMRIIWMRIGQNARRAGLTMEQAINGVEGQQMMLVAYGYEQG